MRCDFAHEAGTICANGVALDLTGTGAPPLELIADATGPQSDSATLLFRRGALAVAGATQAILQAAQPVPVELSCVAPSGSAADPLNGCGRWGGRDDLRLELTIDRKLEIVVTRYRDSRQPGTLEIVLLLDSPLAGPSSKRAQRDQKISSDGCQQIALALMAYETCGTQFC